MPDQNNIDLIKQEVQKLILRSKENLKDVRRLAIDEAWKILQINIAIIIQIIEAIGSNLSGSNKKQLAMELITKFYDTVFMIIDVPFIPNFLEPTIHKYVKSLMLLLVSASIDALVTTFRNAGVFLTKKAEG